MILVDELEEAGGTELSLLALGQGLLARARWRPVFCVLGRDGLVPHFREAGLPVRTIRVGRALSPTAVLSVGRIARRLVAEEASLLHTVHTAADLLGPPAARLLGIPVLSNRRDLGFTKAFRHRLAQRLLNPLVHGVVCVSEAVREVTWAEGGWPDRSRLRVIRNGVDASSFGPAPAPDVGLRRGLGLPEGKPVVAFVGALSPVKGPDLFLDAIARLGDEAAGLVVGEGPMRPALERRAAAKDLAGRVSFAGWRPDVPALLRGAADVFCLPSRSEGLSNSLLEAMATGLPVVAAAVGGNRDVLGPTGAGRLVPPDDVAGLASALRVLIHDPCLARRLGERARELVEREFGLEAMVAAYEAVYDELAKGGKLS